MLDSPFEDLQPSSPHALTTPRSSAAPPPDHSNSKRIPLRRSHTLLPPPDAPKPPPARQHPSAPPTFRHTIAQKKSPDVLSAPEKSAEQSPPAIHKTPQSTPPPMPR